MHCLYFVSQPLLNIWFKEQDWPLETSQIWHSFWSHANPQWEYLFSQNLCIIWHDTRFLFEVTHYMHNRHIACLRLLCLSLLLQWLSISGQQSCHLRGTWNSGKNGAVRVCSQLSALPTPEKTRSWKVSQKQTNKSTFFGSLLLNMYQKLSNEVSSLQW